MGMKSILERLHAFDVTISNAEGSVVIEAYSQDPGFALTTKDRFTEPSGIGKYKSIAETNDTTVELTLSLQPQAEENDFFRNIVLSGVLHGLSLVAYDDDTKETFTCTGGYILKEPDKEKGNTTKQYEWKLGFLNNKVEVA